MKQKGLPINTDIRRNSWNGEVDTHSSDLCRVRKYSSSKNVSFCSRV